MRLPIVIGSAVTVAFLGMVAAVVGGVVAGNQVSVTPGVVTRGVLVAAAIGVTALIWWVRMLPTDRPQTLVTGLSLGWFLNIANWTGNGGVGQLFTSFGVAAAMIDLILWVALSAGVVSLLSSRSTVTAR